MVRPVWFIDVDGVINILEDYAERPHLEQYPDWEATVVAGYRIVFSPSLVEAINRLSQSIDIVFLTTWCADAVEKLAPALGLNITEFRHCDGVKSCFEYRGDDASKRWWKLNAIRDHIQNDQRPFIWTDDDLHNDAQCTVSGRAAFEGVDNLMIAPNPKIGLTNQHIGRIESFLSRVGASEPAK